MSNVINICSIASQAALELAILDTTTKNNMLAVIADSLIEHKNTILEANKVDISNCLEQSQAFIDRLTITEDRIIQMKQGLLELIKLPDPVGEIVEQYTTTSNINISKVRAPLGVVAIIYEARPNVTVDCAGLTIKSSNAVILRGGKDSINSNRTIYNIMKNALNENGYNSNVIQFIDDVTRDSSLELLKQDQYVDVVIPRGGEGLKRFILSNATMPVIASAGGNCHIYVESSADFDMAIDIIINAKVQRPSVCNAVESVLIDQSIATEFIPKLFAELKQNNVEIRGDITCKNIDNTILLATQEDYNTEFLDLIISIKVVESITEAIKHINHYSTKHSEAIITSNQEYAKLFQKSIDAACVYVNTSTRFTDGFEFGFGAEIGISTQKLHARGPLGLKELTSIKYCIESNGEIRQ